MQMHTTKISTYFDSVGLKMTGEEIFPYYPIDNGYIDHTNLAGLMRKCKGLHPHFNCLEKAKIVREHMGYGQIVIGGLLVWNKEKTANFGYYFNPPWEFHAWWEPVRNKNYKLGSIIIDIALPGVIEKGLDTIDHIGPLIEQREPFILAGEPLDWTEYSPAYAIKEEE